MDTSMPKLLYLLLVTIIFSFSSLLQAETKPGSVPNFVLLGERICSMYLAGNITASVERVIKSFMIEEMGIENPPTERIVNVLNRHNADITCDNGKHFTHYAFELGKYNEIVGKLLITRFRVSEDIHYDFNSPIMTYNPETKQEEPMTMVDYIDKVALKTFNISGGENSSGTKHINRIRKMITKRFGAVRFEDLPEEAQAKYR